MSDSPKFFKTPEQKIAAAVTSRERQEIRALAQELYSREREALKLYEPLPIQDEFHRSTAQRRLLRGGNRAGKSLAAAVEVARAALKLDPFKKYRYPGDEFMIFAVGFDQRHIGRKMHTLLLRGGAFQIIQDRNTKRWRAFRPDEDAGREGECFPAPPLIPARHIQDISWENKAKKIWNCVTLHNGSRIFAFPSTGSAPQGDAVDLYWIDEDILDDEWIDEAMARLPDRAGRFIWSAMPHARNDALSDLSRQAADEAHKENPDIVEFIPTFSANPHIPEEQRAKTIRSWAARGEDVLARRDRGEFGMDDWLVYPSYDPTLHTLKRSELGEGIPPDWCRYMVVDPGRQRCAVLFAAVPPPGHKLTTKHGEFCLFYDELYLASCDARRFAEAVRRKSEGVIYEEWVMDEHGGRIREIGSGRSVKDQYREALRSYGLRCRRFGCDFLPGCDNIAARVEAFSGWMSIRQDGTPRLKVLEGALPMFKWEIERYRKKVGRDTWGHVVDVPDTRKNTHLMACAEYLAARDPKYSRPVRSGPLAEDNWAYLRLQQKRERHRESHDLIVL